MLTRLVFIKAFTWFQSLLSKTSSFFFFFQNPVSFSKHHSIFQPVKKLKRCFLLPKLTKEEPVLGQGSTPLLSVSDLAEVKCSLSLTFMLSAHIQTNHHPCLGVALHTSRGASSLSSLHITFQLGQLCTIRHCQQGALESTCKTTGGIRNLLLSLLPFRLTVASSPRSFLWQQIKTSFQHLQKMAYCTLHPYPHRCQRQPRNIPPNESEFQFQESSSEFLSFKKIPIFLLCPSSPRGVCYFCSCDALKPQNCLIFLLI